MQHGKYRRTVAAAYRSVEVLRKAGKEIEDRGRIGGDTDLEVRQCERLGCWQSTDIDEAIAKTRANARYEFDVAMAILESNQVGTLLAQLLESRFI